MRDALDLAPRFPAPTLRLAPTIHARVRVRRLPTRVGSHPKLPPVSTCGPRKKPCVKYQSTKYTVYRYCKNTCGYPGSLAGTRVERVEAKRFHI